MASYEDWEMLSSRSDSPVPPLTPTEPAGVLPPAANQTGLPKMEQCSPDYGTQICQLSAAPASPPPSLEESALVLPSPAAAGFSEAGITVSTSGASPSCSGSLQHAQQAAEEEASAGRTTVVLVGAIGSGKSSCGNIILGRHAFAAKHAAGPVTKTTASAAVDENDPKSVYVIDTPGLGETGGQGEAARLEVMRALAEASEASGRVGIAVVLSAARPYTTTDHSAICSLVTHFGASILRRVLLVFTHGDVLTAEGTSLQDYLADAPSDLQAVLQQVSGRTMLLDKRATAEEQRSFGGALLASVDEMLAVSQLSSFEMPAWNQPPAKHADSDSALRTSVDGKPQDGADSADQPDVSASQVSRKVTASKTGNAAQLAAALAASEKRRLQLERTVREMPRLRRGIAYALTACGILGLRMLGASREGSYCNGMKPGNSVYNMYGPISWSLEPCSITAAEYPIADTPAVLQPPPVYRPDVASH